MLYNVLLNSNPTKKSQVSYSDRYFDDMYTSGLKLETGIGEYIRKNNSKTNMSISKNDILNSSKNILPSCEIDNSKACLNTTSSGNSCSD